MFLSLARCSLRPSQTLPTRIIPARAIPPRALPTRTVNFRHISSTTSRAQNVVSKAPKRPYNPAEAQVEKGKNARVDALAYRLLKDGHNEIYRNTASRGYVMASFAIMIVSYCGVGYIYSTRLWNLEVAKERKLHWLVPIAYQVVMLCWGGIAAYAFSRTLGIVKSIRLIKQGEQISVETAIRRAVPFMRPEKYTSDVHTLTMNKSKLYGAVNTDGMITAPEGNTLISKITRNLFYTPFHNTRKALGGVGFVPIEVGPTGSRRHLRLDIDGQFSNGGQDLLDLSQDEPI